MDEKEEGDIRARCIANTKRGGQCKRHALHSYCYCRSHLKLEGECPICFETDVNHTLECGHRFHHSCFEGWKQTRRAGEQDVTCPMCRCVISKTRRSRPPSVLSHIPSVVSPSVVSPSVVSPIYDMDHLVQTLQQMFPFPSQIIELMAQELVTSLDADYV